MATLVQSSPAFSLIANFFGRWFGGHNGKDLVTPDVGNQGTPDPPVRTHVGHVSTDSALTLSAVFAAVRIITETVASLPMDFYRGESGERIKDNACRSAKLLRESPNEYMTAQEFREAMTMQLVLQGNAYALKHRNSRGDVVAIDPLQTDRMEVQRKASGALVYVYATGKRTDGVFSGTDDKLVIDARDIIHLKGFGFNGTTGLSTIAYARNTFGLASAAEDYGADFFEGGGKPAGILMVDKMLTPEQRTVIRKNFTDLADGRGSGRLKVLEAHMKYEPITIPPEDAQFLATRAFSVAEIGRFFNVQGFLLNDGQQTTWGSGIEQLNLAFLTYTLRPYLTRWESVLKRALISDVEGKAGADLIAEHNVEGLLRTDSKARVAYYGGMVDHGLMCRNECRAKENLPPIPGGDVFTVQVNLAPLDKLGQRLIAPAKPHEKVA